jgi:hypothetical protein
LLQLPNLFFQAGILGFQRAQAGIATPGKLASFFSNNSWHQR